MIRHTESQHGPRYHIGLQRKDNNYTFLHWLNHDTQTSRFKWLKFSLILKQYEPIGPTSLVEWQDE